jgi:hypothetical protein
MGTNYYMATKAACKECGHKEPSRHIGKSSAGWVFALHVYPDEGINDLDDWKPLLEAAPEIRDEYDRIISVEDMLSTITGRSWPKLKPGFDYARNGAEPGPNNLIRCKPNQHGVTHGAGTWDCHTGDFS